MKVLLVHNFYGSSAPSGENSAVEEERRLLTRGGVDVETLFTSSDSIRGKGVLGLLEGGVATPWNPRTKALLASKLQAWTPDVVHVHNTFPILSPSIFHYLRAAGLPVVMTVHNYRLLCSAGTLSRDGRACAECFDRLSPVPGLVHGCYRSSRIATLPVYMMIELHRYLRTWARCVDRFIVLSDFQRSLLARAGVSDSRMVIKPPSYIDAPTQVEWDRRDGGVAYVGRLSSEKGVAVLLEAWKALGASAPPLDIVGDGDVASELKAYCSRERLRDVTFHGALPHEAAIKVMSKSKLLVIPSLAYEGFPMVVREAFALGVPIVGTDHGSLKTLVRDGMDGALLPPGDATALARRISELWSNDATLQAYGASVRLRFEQEMGEKTNLQQLLSVYRSAREGLS